MTNATENLTVAAAQRASMKHRRFVVIDRDWASYTEGTRFVIVQSVPCGPVRQADGSTINPVNLRVILEADKVNDARTHRTIPQEYAVELPEINSAFDIEANQGVREGTVLATVGSQFLVEYEMPYGRTFGRVLDVLKPDWFRAVPMNNLPRKWKQKLAM